jgi:hypothetical protein
VIALGASPDYVSHDLPLSAIGEELRASGVEVDRGTGRGAYESGGAPELGRPAAGGCYEVERSERWPAS